MRSIATAFAKYLICCLAVTLTAATGSWAQSATSSDTDVAKHLRGSAQVLNEVMSAPDKGIPEEVLLDAKCIAVVPSMVKIAVGFGGHYCRGVATCRTANGWSAPAPILLTGGSWGLQFGG